MAHELGHLDGRQRSRRVSGDGEVVELVGLGWVLRVGPRPQRSHLQPAVRPVLGLGVLLLGSLVRLGRVALRVEPAVRARQGGVFRTGEARRTRAPASISRFRAEKGTGGPALSQAADLGHLAKEGLKRTLRPPTLPQSPPPAPPAPLLPRRCRLRPVRDQAATPKGSESVQPSLEENKTQRLPPEAIQQGEHRSASLSCRRMLAATERRADAASGAPQPKAGAKRELCRARTAFAAR